MFRKNQFKTIDKVVKEIEKEEAKRQKDEMNAKKKKEKSKNEKNPSILANTESKLEKDAIDSCALFSEHMQEHYRKEWSRFTSVVSDKRKANNGKLRILDIAIALKHLQEQAGQLLEEAKKLKIYSESTSLMHAAVNFKNEYSEVFELFEAKFNELKENNARLASMSDKELYKQLSCISKIKKENDKVNAKLSKISVAGAEYERMFNIFRENHNDITEMLATAEKFISEKKFGVNNEIDLISEITKAPFEKYHAIKEQVEIGLAMAAEKKREMAAARAAHGFHTQPNNNQEKETTDTLDSHLTLHK